ncbi:MAG TPA: hypothetical protein VHC43_07395 [Mycobacteriales bacterium]|nr:hypothetical protein [Mycobacteriales bacterium]
MIRIRRTVGAAAVLMSTLVPALPVAAHPAPALAVIGRLAYLTPAGVLDEVVVNADGSVSSPQQLGPVTVVAAPETVKVTDPVQSNDHTRIAWSEVISKPSAKYGELETGAVLVLLDTVTGESTTLRSEYAPLGFAGHRLVVSGASTKRFVASPTPHLVKVHDGDAYAVATYSKGIVDVASSVGKHNDSIETDRLRLTTFGGHHTLLHVYKVGTDYRSAAANVDLVSPDGKKLLVELGNHQDFEGLGPSSNYDTFSLGRSHARKQLGHYGTGSADWRMWQATFVGPSNQPWLAIHSGFEKNGTTYVVRGAIVRYAGGRWSRQLSRGIAVAGNQAGYVVVQGGTWDAVKNSPAGEYLPNPDGDAQLEGPGGSHALTGIEGTQFLWAG